MLAESTLVFRLPSTALLLLSVETIEAEFGRPERSPLLANSVNLVEKSIHVETWAAMAFALVGVMLTVVGTETLGEVCIDDAAGAVVVADVGVDTAGCVEIEADVAVDEVCCVGIAADVGVEAALWVLLK